MSIKWNPNFNLPVYQPKKRRGIRKEEVVHHTFKFGTLISKLGGTFILSFFFIVSMLRMFFNIKDNFYIFNRKKKIIIVKRK